MANSWAQQAGAYYRSQRKTRKDLSFGNALKELSKLRKSGNMPNMKSNNRKTKSRKSRKSKSRE